MGRMPRLHYPGGLYHVISRGNQRQRIFHDSEDYQVYLKKLDEYRKRYGFLLYAYVLMPNHVHLLVEVGAVSLSRIMQGLQQGYAVYYNRRHRKVGHLFQGRYKAILCEKEEYLLQLIRYLHCNPIRAKLVDDPSAYRWSSHSLYLKGISDGMTAVEEILLRFSDRRKEALRRYSEFIRDGQKEGHRPDYYRVVEQRYLGNDEFLEQVRRERIETEEPHPIQISLNEIALRVAEETGVSVKDLQAEGRRRDYALARTMTAYLARRLGGIPLKTSARWFGREPVTVTILIRRFEDRLKIEPSMRRLVSRLERDLRDGRKVKYNFINV